MCSHGFYGYVVLQRNIVKDRSKIMRKVYIADIKFSHVFQLLDDMILRPIDTYLMAVNNSLQNHDEMKTFQAFCFPKIVHLKGSNKMFINRRSLGHRKRDCIRLR